MRVDLNCARGFFPRGRFPALCFHHGAPPRDEMRWAGGGEEKGI